MANAGRGGLGGNGGPGGDDLRQPLEELREELRMLGDRIGGMPAKAQDQQGIEKHLKRYMPFYALATVWVLMLVLFPTVNRSGNNDELKGVGVSGGGGVQGSSALGSDTAYGEELAAQTAQTGAGGAIGGTGGTVGGRAGGTTGVGGVKAKVSPAVEAGVQIGTGVTRGGFECKPGVRQIPWSAYAGQCVAKFSADNGGATWRGITKDTIKIADREFPDSANRQAVAAFAQAAGAASPEVAEEVRNTFREWFMKVFELYGRKIVWEEYPASAQSNGTEEAQSRGKEGACIDATKVAEEVKAFMVQGASGPYGECLAERGVIASSSGAYFPETWYRRYHPYLYNGVMECERISYQVAEYMGKRLAGRKAKWAGDPLFQTQNRKFGTYVPNNDEYQHCVNISERVLKEKYGTEITSRYNYTLDVSRFPDEAARGMVQFKAAGVTTVINACDPYSTTFMTQAAAGQNYKPEWYIIGVAAQDADSVARLFDQSEVDGHMYGMSQLGAQWKLWGPNSEPGKTYKFITGKDIPPGTEGGYFGLIGLFNMLQAAGPNLSPTTFEKGVHSIMAGGPPELAVGYTSYQDGPDGTPGATDHTAVDDSREVYWCGTCKSKLDGKAGTYIEIAGGKRYRNNEWTNEEPPAYPPGYKEANAG